MEMLTFCNKLGLIVHYCLMFLCASCFFGVIGVWFSLS